MTKPSCNVTTGKRGMPTSKEGLFKGSPLRSSMDSVSTKRTNRPKE